MPGERHGKSHAMKLTGPTAMTPKITPASVSLAAPSPKATINPPTTIATRGESSGDGASEGGLQDLDCRAINHWSTSRKKNCESWQKNSSSTNTPIPREKVARIPRRSRLLPLANSAVSRQANGGLTSQHVHRALGNMLAFGRSSKEQSGCRRWGRWPPPSFSPSSRDG